MNKELEWKLYNDYQIEIMHIQCDNFACVPTCSHEEIKMWHCFVCKKKVPNHVILQWKIATGK